MKMKNMEILQNLREYEQQYNKEEKEAINTLLVRGVTPEQYEKMYKALKEDINDANSTT